MKKVFQLIPVILFSILFLNSCKKNKVDEQYQETVHPALPDLSTQINASVEGFITDENGAGLEAATVAKGTKTTLTDSYGYFRLDSVDFAKSAGFIKVNKAGYFTGIRTFLPTAGKQTFIRLQLIRKAISGTINSDIGGTVSTADGASVTLASNAVVVESNSAPYTGTVNIAVHWLNPADMEVTQLTMPGDLRGVDSLGYLNTLTTWGMLAVELTGDAGQLLQIASGTHASLNFPIPASLQSSAPASIPLWHFDESMGLWKQDGRANKTGSNYVGDVSHFSYWNCDIPNAGVNFNAQIINSSLQPIPNIAVSITIQGVANSTLTSFTDADGRVSGMIPANSALFIRVSAVCNPSIYTQELRTTTTDVDLGSITINVQQYGASFTGYVKNCSGAPVTNGYVIIASGLHTYALDLQNGSFNVAALICPNGNASVIAFDRESVQQSAVQNFTLVPGVNDFDTTTVCGTSIDESITYWLDGAPSGLYIPWHVFAGDFDFVNNRTNIHGTDQINMNTSFDLSFDGPDDITGLHPVTAGSVVVLNNVNYHGTFTNVDLTSYGLIGEFITGSFSSVTISDDFGIQHSLIVNFNIRRTQ